MIQSSLKFIETDHLSSFTDEGSNAEIWYSKSDVLDNFLKTSEDYLSLRIWLEKEPDITVSELNSESIKILLRRTIDSIDKRLNDQINEILHHEDFKQLESSWRGLKYLTNQSSSFDTEMPCKVKIVHLSWRELSRDIARAIEFDQSDFFRLIYSNEFTMPGGEPFGLLIGDYCISHKPTLGLSSNDIDTLQGISSASASAFAPFITTADPSLFGVDRFSDLAHVKDINSQFSQAEYFKWRSLRESEDSRFLGIVVPNILMREPYKRDGSRRERFYFIEKVKDSQKDYLWGSGAYAFAAVTLKAFSESGWFSQIRGIVPGHFKRGLVYNIPKSRVQLSRNVEMLKPSVDLQVGDSLEKQLSDSGFIPLTSLSHTEHLAFYSNASVNKPKIYDSESVNVNAKLSSMLQYTLCTSRFAHYIKVMGRDKIGSYASPEQIENYFQRWLFKYTTASDEASDEVRAKYPLNEARIKVREYTGRTGYFYSIIHLRPHFQLDEMVSSMRLITELSPYTYNTG